MKATDTIALHQRVATRRQWGGTVSKPTIFRAVGRICLMASTVLAQVAFLQCAAGAILAGAGLPGSTTDGKGGAL